MTVEFFESPLSVQKQGAFFVGGAYSRREDGGTQMLGQMFVQYQIPATKSHIYPIVLVHGTAQTGMNYIETPDGRPGWSEYFVRNGFATYVVDFVTRGRSGHNSSRPDAPKLDSISAEQIAGAFTAPPVKSWPGADKHTQWPGKGTAGDPAFDQYFASLCEYFPGDDVQLEEENASALVELLDKIGPSVLVTHSRSGPIGWLVCDRRPTLVKAIVALEPGGPPFIEAPPKEALFRRDYGLSAAELKYEPALEDSAELKSLHPLVQKDGDRVVMEYPKSTHFSLPNLKDVAVMIVTAEASYHAGYDEYTHQFLQLLGVDSEWIQLKALGIHGNGHMMMLEKNNLDIAAVIKQWLDKKLQNGE